MMTDNIGQPDAIALSDYRFKTIHQDGIVAFSRGIHAATGATVLIAHAASSQVEADAAHILLGARTTQRNVADDGGV